MERVGIIFYFGLFDKSFSRCEGAWFSNVRKCSDLGSEGRGVRVRECLGLCTNEIDEGGARDVMLASRVCG